MISIHVPSWGTTKKAKGEKLDKWISIHVPSWGTTRIAADTATWAAFQSTFPRGERRPEAPMQDVEQNFNPRSLVGNDVRACYHPILPVISIHVPSWGTTTVLRHMDMLRTISIHVPSWGTTIQKVTSGKEMAISIHVPSWGTTQTTPASLRILQFQSTFPRGERRQIFTNILCFFMQ